MVYAAQFNLLLRNQGETIVKNKIVGKFTLSSFAAMLLLGALLVVNSSIFADDSKHRHYAPDQAGPYGIGHTTVVLTDTSRNLDGSTPVTSAGRFLHLDIWYPTKTRTNEHVSYTWNNPIYNENPGGAIYPGLPDLAPLTSAGALSANPVLDNAPLARKGKFPLLVASHGNLVASAKNMPDTLEALASHGYVVASIEHTGNDDAWYQADWLGRRLGLPIGPNPSIGANGTILQRTMDVSFVIDAVLEGVVDQQTGMRFSRQIDASNIGVLGFSLGGQTSLATVTGISSAGYPADRRVKAAFMGGGSNWGLLLDSTDYANARVPLLFFGNDTGIAYDAFNQFTGSRKKYLVDIGDYNHHIGGYQSSWCQDFQNSMEVVNPDVFPAVFFGGAPFLDRSDIANYIFDATFYWIYTGTRNSGVYDYCEPSVFDNISDEQLVATLFGNPDILAVRDELIGSMPLKPEASIAEVTRMTDWYAVSFFNKTLKNEHEYSRYLNNSKANQRRNPLVRLVRDCQKEEPHPLDLQPLDKITFMPVGDSGYDVSVTSAAALYDQGPTALVVAGGGTATLNFPGFSFPVPGLPEPIVNLIVNENGVITTRTSADIGEIDDNGSPWYMKGHMLLSGQFVIGALMKNLDAAAASAGGGVFGYFDAVQNRVIVTYSGIPAGGTTEPNTLQIAIYNDGKVEMIIGELAATGTAVSPSILGTLGIAGGHTRIRDLRRVKPVDFSQLRDNGSVFMPFDSEAAIFEQFYTGTDRSCHARNDHDDDNESS